MVTAIKHNLKPECSPCRRQDLLEYFKDKETFPFSNSAIRNIGIIDKNQWN